MAELEENKNLNTKLKYSKQFNDTYLDVLQQIWPPDCILTWSMMSADNP